MTGGVVCVYRRSAAEGPGAPAESGAIAHDAWSHPIAVAESAAEADWLVVLDPQSFPFDSLAAVPSAPVTLVLDDAHPGPIWEGMLGAAALSHLTPFDLIVAPDAVWDHLAPRWGWLPEQRLRASSPEEALDRSLALAEASADLAGAVRSARQEAVVRWTVRSPAVKAQYLALRAVLRETLATLSRAQWGERTERTALLVGRGAIGFTAEFLGFREVTVGEMRRSALAPGREPLRVERVGPRLVLPGGGATHDVVVAVFALTGVPERDERRRLLEALWRRVEPAHPLVVLDAFAGGHPAVPVAHLTMPEFVEDVLEASRGAATMETVRSVPDPVSGAHRVAAVVLRRMGGGA